MNGAWRKFADLFGDAEVAVMAILVLFCSLITAAALVAKWLVAGYYEAACGLLLAVAATTGICVRDYRRQRWSMLSTALVTIWLLATLAAWVFGFWVVNRQG
jgi:hypothetical protein